MRPRFWVAYGALALALAFLAPSLTPLTQSMDAFSEDLANGSFRPFGEGQAPLPSRAFSGTLGGFTGESQGNYLPGAATVPQQWLMDRDGRGGRVVIDEVFDPGLGAMKRLKAYDRVAADGLTLEVADTRVALVGATSGDDTLSYDRSIQGSYRVALQPGVLIPVFSPHPKARVIEFSTGLPQGSVQFFRDGADTLYVRANVERTITLNVTFHVSSDYYSLPTGNAWRTSDYRFGPTLQRPSVPSKLAEESKLVLARAGVDDPTDVLATLDALSRYFRSFTEGDIPEPTEVESLYLALALGERGCCRHRAFAFMVTAQSVGIPTRVVVNEAHAFVEVALPNGHWHQINLGGCGSYELNNPNGYQSLFDQATDPRGEANPEEGKLVDRVTTITNITDAPTRIVKGERYLVNGTVRTSNGAGVAGARIDLFLNETKTTPGKLTGTGTTRRDGSFSIEAAVPSSAPARPYQLVARAKDGAVGPTRYAESWSDPEVSVFAPTRFTVPPVSAAVGFPATIVGRLVDLDGNGVPNATIPWTADGVTQLALTTDGVGRFTGRVTFDTRGDHVVRLRFEGTPHHGPSEATVVVNAGAGAILLPPDPPVLVRGEGGIVSGQVAVQGANLQGRVVTAVLGNVTAQATTDAEGSFSIALVPHATATPGTYVVRLAVPSLSLDNTIPARVLARPVLTVLAPTLSQPRETWTVQATLASDNGAMLAGAIVELTFDGNATPRILLTNQTGVARFDVQSSDLGRGRHTLRVTFPGDAAHIAQTRTANVEIATPWWAAVPAWAWAALLALPLLALALLPLVRPGGPLRRAWTMLLAGVSRPQRRFLALAFPDHPPGVPPVFEPGEAARVRVRLRDREGRPARGRVGLVAGTERMTGDATEEGAWFEVRIPDAPTLHLRAHAVGVARLYTRPLDVELPAQSYRAAVESGFVALRARAHLPASATPGDVVDHLAPRLAPARRQELRRAVSLFDEADYSERPVDRAFYHAFARAAATVRDDIEEVADAR